MLQQRKGKKPRPIVVSPITNRVVQRAILAGTLTTIVVFVPLYMIETEASPLLRELATRWTEEVGCSLDEIVAVISDPS